jgi:hypothetical protein
MTLQLPISNPMSPLRNLYDHRFHKNLKCPRAYLTTLALRTVRGLILKDIISGLLNYVKK